jgi:hypothetical protein
MRECGSHGAVRLPLYILNDGDENLLKLSVSRVALCSAESLSKNQLAAQLRSGLLLFPYIP